MRSLPQLRVYKMLIEEKYKLMLKSLEEIENIYKEIAEEDKRLCEDFLSISLETVGL